MTEDEAKTRWCPFAHSRVISYHKNDGVQQLEARYSLVEEQIGTTCIASACMAWRPSRRRYDEHARQYVADPADGYCGLAGQP